MVHESDPAAKDAHGESTSEEMESFSREQLGSEHRPSIQFACMTFYEDMIYPLDDGRNKACTHALTHPFHTQSSISCRSGTHPTLPSPPPMSACCCCLLAHPVSL
jgi:hypothetical protein